MKTNFKIGWPYLVAFIISLILSGIIVFLLLKLAEKKSLNENLNPISEKINQIKDAVGETRAVVQTNKKNSKKQDSNNDFLKSEIEKLKKALELEKSDKISAITKFDAALKDSVKLYAMRLDAERNKVWEWKKKYESGSKIEAKMNEKDSVLQLTNIDIKTEIADVEAGRGKNKQFFTEFYTPDQNITFNGAKTFRVEQKEIKDILQGDFKLGYRKDFLSTDYDRFEGTFQFFLFPDNDFTVGFGAGTVYLMNQHKIKPFGEIFLRQNLFRVKKAR